MENLRKLSLSLTDVAFIGLALLSIGVALKVSFAEGLIVFGLGTLIGAFFVGMFKYLDGV